MMYCYMCGGPLWLGHRGWMGQVVITTNDKSGFKKPQKYDYYGGFIYGNKLYEGGRYVACHEACARDPNMHSCLIKLIDPTTGLIDKVKYGPIPGPLQFPEDYMDELKHEWILEDPRIEGKNQQRVQKIWKKILVLCDQ